MLILSVSTVHASTAQLKRANRLFVKGDYENALKAYDDALVDQPHSSILHFNAGDAAYQSGDLSRATKEFEEAQQSAIPVIKSAAHYNRANALFRQQRWADAVEAYKEALRVDPNDEDAKYNLGVALRLQKNPPPPQQSKGGNNDQKDKKGGQGQKDDQKGQGQQQQPQPQSGQMSREDAERLLAAAGAGEQKKSNQKAARNEVPHPDEDW